MKIAVYTSIFGPYDGLLPQPEMKDVDYFCFTDQEFESETWTIIRKEAPIKDDPVRSARYHKINPHLFLTDYDVSIWMDGNMIITGDIQELPERLSEQTPMLIFDHSQSNDARNTVKEELDELISLVKEEKKRVRIQLMQEQVETYKKEGFPDEGGLIFSAVLIRRHQHPEVVKTMKLWWEQLQKYSNRDQLSFNYAAWKTGLHFDYLNGDLRDGNPWFHMIGRHRKSYKGKWFRYRLKKLFGLKK